MNGYQKPLPVADEDSRPYWDGANAHELRAQRCSDCGRLRWPPAGVCPQCQRWNHSWEKLNDQGTVTSYVIVHRSGAEGFANDVPYIIAKVTIDGTDGNVTITSNIIDCAIDRVRVGLPVRAVFKQVTPEVTLPLFQPLTS